MDILGIEIRDDSLAVTRLKGSLFNLRVEGSALLKGDSAVERLEALKSHMKASGIKGARIAVTLPRGLTISRAVEIPAPDASAIEGILRFELERHLPFGPDDAYYGFQTLKREKNSFSVLFAAARKEDVDRVVDVFISAGLEPSYIGAWQASLFNAFDFWKGLPRDGNTAFIGLDKGSVSLDIFSGPFPVYSRRMDGCRNSEERIGWLKRELKLSLSSQGFPRGGEIDNGIVISDSNSDSDDEPDDGLIRGLSGAVKNIVSAGRIKGLGLPPSAAPSLGAALSALGRGRLDLNLGAEGLKGKGAPVQRYTAALAALAVFLLASAGASYIIKDVTGTRRLEAALSEAKAGKEKAEALAGGLKAMDARIRELEEVKGPYPSGGLEVMRELSVSLPKDTWLTAFEYGGGAVSIEGFSGRASSLLIDMGRSRLVKDVEFIGPVTKAQGGKERFRIRFRLKDAARG